MLKEIKIINFALIEEVFLEFKKGFTIISGETGSGKSILIDAICFVLGDKFDKGIIRNGEKTTSVEVVFDIESDKIEKIFEQNFIGKEDYLFIRRDGDINGKSIVRINGKVVPIHVLKSVAKNLMDIHTQHENYDLLSSANHIYYLDRYIGESILFDKYLSVYNSWSQLKLKIESIRNNDLDESYVDYIKFQLNELNEAALTENEDEELENKIKILSNVEKINKSIQIVMNDFRYSEEFSINNNMLNIIKVLKSIEDISLNITGIVNKLEEIYYDLDSISVEIEKIGEDSNIDIGELDNINARIYFINSLKRKYKKISVYELIKYRDELCDLIDEFSNKEFKLNKLEEQEKEIYERLEYCSGKLTNIRKQKAKEIETQIVRELDYMGMKNVTFDISIVQDKNFTCLGNDRVEFLISTNKGEPLKNLSKVVSGGELSRIMLALKIVFLGNEPISGIVFDEIDSGISGKVARKVGEKMYYLSTKCQVFCITHLPQIASLSDNHYLAIKNVLNDKTFTNIKISTYEEKINEIAKMIVGENITDNAYQNAKDLVEKREKLIE